MPPKQDLRRHLLIAAAIAAPLLAGGSGALRPVDDAVAAWRMAVSPREATGEIVHLAIDKKSLDRIGVWPWPREVHAEIVDALVAAGAADIAIDIDFSTASDPDSDRALAGALARAAGSVILPAFTQHEAVGPDAELGFNLPLPEFREHAWIGSVGLRPGPDGVIRSFPFGAWISGEDVPSFPALLAGRTGPPGVEFGINFALDPGSVPAYSAIDLIEGRVGAEELDGRRVLFGAHAIELGDLFAVPVHGVLPGPLLQILAAESLAQGIELRPPPSRAWILAAGALLFTLALWPRSAGLRRRTASLVTFAAGVEAAAALVQARYAVVVPTAGIHFAALAAAATLVLQELDLRSWMERLASLRASNIERVLKRIIEDSSDAILILQEDGRLLETSHRARVLLALDGDDGLPAAMRRDAEQAIARARGGLPDERLLRELTVEVDGEVRILEYTVTPSRLARLRRTRPGEEEETIVASVTARDVTERRRHLDRLDYLARFDEGTGALRRGEFLARLASALAGWPEAPGTCAVFALDLNRFGAVNLSFGREVGDLVLAAAAERLAACDPRLGPPARLDGDRFALFSQVPVGDDAAQAIAAALIACIERPFEVAGTTARIGARVGLAAGGAASEAGSVLAAAESALDEARRSGGGATVVFDPASASRQERRRKLERDLWSAIARDELHLVYQPQVRLSDRALIGAEALVRWRHPELGPVSPVEFIEIAEENGFVERLGRWVLETACAEAAHWPAALTVAVNVSPVQLTRSDVVGDVLRTLGATGLPAGRLQLEITESSFLAPTDAFLELLADIRMTGVTLAIDDFGSGFSSLGYIARFPLDKIKADRMFVQRLGQDRASGAVLRSVVLLAEELGVRLVAEGVETEAQHDFLRRSRCHDGQGYLFGRPMPAADFRAVCREALPADASAGGTPARQARGR